MCLVGRVIFLTYSFHTLQSNYHSPLFMLSLDKVQDPTQNTELVRQIVHLQAAGTVSTTGLKEEITSICQTSSVSTPFLLRFD